MILEQSEELDARVQFHNLQFQGDNLLRHRSAQIGLLALICGTCERHNELARLAQLHCYNPRAWAWRDYSTGGYKSKGILLDLWERIAVGVTYYA